MFKLKEYKSRVFLFKVGDGVSELNAESDVGWGESTRRHEGDRGRRVVELTNDKVTNEYLVHMKKMGERGWGGWGINGNGLRRQSRWPRPTSLASRPGSPRTPPPL